MSTLLISDTSVLIDLERGLVLEAGFRTSYELAVPDVLYRRELAPHGGDQLVALGLNVMAVDAAGVKLAVGYRARQRRISVADSLSLALARRIGATLMTGDALLRGLAEEDDVECHGLLWLFDVFDKERVLDPRALLTALEKIHSHPRCRLPEDEVLTRLQRYAAAILKSR
jgi:hypothetical protein